MYAHGLILPVLALVAWSLVVWAWMVASRVAYMSRERISPQKAERTQHPARSSGSPTTTTT